MSDPQAVAKQLSGRPRELESIWLVAADAQLLEESVDPAAHDVVVVHGLGSRVTRLPSQPVLGRRARWARAQRLRDEAEAHAARLDASERRRRRLDAWLRELAPVLQDVSVIGGERLSPLREACHEQLEQLREQRRQLELELTRNTALIAETEPRVQALRALLVDAFLLDGRDHGEAYTALSQGIAEGEAAERELSRVAEARARLLSTANALRFPPGDSQARSVLERSRDELDREHDRWFAIAEALSEASELRACFDSNAEQRVEESVALVPALEEQREAARVALAETESVLEQAETRARSRDARLAASRSRAGRARRPMRPPRCGAGARRRE